MPILMEPTDSGVKAMWRLAEPTTSESEFKAIGLASFFDTQDDTHVDWEDMFDVSLGDATTKT